MLNRFIDKYENFCAKHSRELMYTCAFIIGLWIGEERVNRLCNIRTEGIDLDLTVRE